jgi:phosphohistidine phosphatase SixA
MIREPRKEPPTVKELELRRPAQRDPAIDRLTPEGRAQAEDAGRSSTASYVAVFVSPATRAAETAAWFLRGAGQQLPDHAVIPGLGGRDASGGSPEGMATGVRAILDGVPDGGRALAISHHPLVERAAFGLTGREIPPLGECEGIIVTLADGGAISVAELRLDDDEDRTPS